MPSENGISLLVLVPDCGNAAVAVRFLPRRRADGPFPCPGCTRVSARALLGQGWGSCKAAGAPPVWWQWPARQGQPAGGRAGVGTTVDTTMPWIHRESPQPLAEGPAGIPTGEMEGVAAWQTLRPAAPSSAQQRPAPAPEESSGRVCRAGPARAHGHRRRFITAGRSAVVGAVGNANMNLQLWIFF